MKLGLFLMPLHDPHRDLAPAIREDRDCVVYLDGLGYDEVWVGEHCTATSEPITDPLQFLASVMPVTSHIRLGTGVINLPQHHPLQVAGSAALLDVMSGGRLMMGVGPGGLGADMEVFGTLGADRNAMMVEAVDMIHAIWAGDPPYDLRGRFWTIKLSASVNPSLGHGFVLKPVQRPHPPVFTTAMSAQSGPAGIAGERGWGLISANFIPVGNVKRHWDGYRAGAERAGRRPDRGLWRLARSIVVAPTDAEAAAYLERPGNAVWWYYDYFHRNLSSRGMLGIFKASPDVPDRDVTVRRILDEIVISGSPKRVLDRLVAVVDEIGAFGGLLVARKEWDDAAFHKRSFALVADEVLPKLRDYSASRGCA